MKNKFKVTISILLILITILNISPAVFAYEVVGEVLSTDIKAYINEYEIPAYNINGKLAILVVDLNNYGFTTYYDDNIRTSSVSRNSSAEIFTSTLAPDFDLPIGTPVMNVYASDIVVNMEGQMIQSFNVNNHMAIYFSELKVFGTYRYNNDTRSSSLVLSETNSTDTFTALTDHSSVSQTISSRSKTQTTSESGSTQSAPRSIAVSVGDKTKNKSPSKGSSRSSEAETSLDLSKYYLDSSKYYLLNTNTGVFHFLSCNEIKKMSDKNKQLYSGSRSDLIAAGYRGCQKCHS